ncbi:MAG: SOS response-associated peptidase [Gemmatimonadota bacterium]|nr:MAG: SOS response-associated peptidase [Gemmatimonadota bacterium]
MCYNISLDQNRESIENRFNAKFVEPPVFRPIYHASGFSFPLLPIISNQEPDAIQFFQWGLIPQWVKNKKTAKSFRTKTLNARSETIFEKPSFKHSIRIKRCLVLVDGFFEWRHVEKKKYPYYITLLEHDIFSLAGIWDAWTIPENGETIRTFSIITTAANTLMEKIHNTKKRMPVLIRRERERDWLKNEMTQDDIQSFFKPFDPEKMEAYPVSKLLSTRGANTNTPEVMQRHEYPELKD